MEASLLVPAATIIIELVVEQVLTATRLVGIWSSSAGMQVRVR
jgi:hypothetical protein